MARRDRQVLRRGRERASRLPERTAPLFLAALLFSACATVPRGTVRERDEFSALGAGAMLYLRVDIPAARSILDAVARRLPSELGKGRSGELLDRTDSAAIALFDEGGPRRFLIATRGRYPTGRAAFSLALDSSWKKETAASGGRYWRSASGVSLAFRRDAALISDGEPFAAGTSPKLPAAYSGIVDEPISGWIPEPASRLADILDKMGAPVRPPIDELIFVCLREDGAEAYRIRTYLIAPSPERARSLAAILRLVGSNLERTRSTARPLMPLLFSSPPVLDGSTVILGSPPMTSEEIALLCADVSIYLKQ